MEFAEKYAIPVDGKLGTNFPRRNDFKEMFDLRWGRIRFEVFWGVEVNIKVVLKVYRNDDNTCEHFIVDTNPYDVQRNIHKRVTEDFYVDSFSRKHGRVKCVKFSYIVHFRNISIPSQYDYIFMDGHHFDGDRGQRRHITSEWTTLNTYRTYELDAAILQSDTDWYNRHFESLHLIPKFTKGLPYHPDHPKRFIHDHIDKVIQKKT